MKWFFDGDAATDPEKEAKADGIELENETENLATIYARKGRNWKEELRQRAEERAFQQDLEKEFGLEPEVVDGKTTEDEPQEEEANA